MFTGVLANSSVKLTSSCLVVLCWLCSDDSSSCWLNRVLQAAHCWRCCAVLLVLLPTTSACAALHDCREADLWLNDPEVRSALHAAPLELTGPWTVCSDRISYTADAGSMLPIHKELTRKRGARHARLLRCSGSCNTSCV
jgi:hypothetical protein